MRISQRLSTYVLSNPDPLSQGDYGSEASVHAYSVYTHNAPTPPTPEHDNTVELQS